MGRRRRTSAAPREDLVSPSLPLVASPPVPPSHTASVNPCHAAIPAHVTPPSPQITRDGSGAEVQRPNVAGGIYDREVRGKGFRSGGLGGGDPRAGDCSAAERDTRWEPPAGERRPGSVRVEGRMGGGWNI